MRAALVGRAAVQAACGRFRVAEKPLEQSYNYHNHPLAEEAVQEPGSPGIAGLA
jgi:hypothetical protein